MNTPNIRFKGFSDDWEQRKFGDITDLKSASRVHKDEWTADGVPFYRSSDVMAAFNGTQNEKAFISEELYEKLSSVSGKLEEGDILVTGGGSVGTPYIVQNNEPLYTKDADLLWIKNQGRFDDYFVYEFFLSPKFRNYLKSISHVGTIAHYTITQLSETPISLPSYEAQKKIGNFFRNLENLIVLHQRKCDSIKQVKKYMLQKMFPKQDEKVPEIRFAGFTGDWEQRKLGDQMYIKSRIGWQALTKKEYLNDGEYYLITGTDIDEDTHTIDLKNCYYVSKERYEMDDKIQLHEGDIIVTKDGTIGKVAMVTGLDKPATLNSHLFVLRDLSGSLDNRFLLQVLNSHVFNAFIESTKTGSTLTGLPQKTFVEFKFLAPKLEEQKRISNTLDNIDRIITLHQRKSDSLKEIKKFMLQNMFPRE